jgi:hypothetical protein
MMKTFRVWMRPLVNAGKIRVEGLKNARWLLDRLSRSFVFKSSESINDDEANSCSTFSLQYNSQISCAMVEKLLVAMPEVQLLPEMA